jgi:hypothetical protein
MTEAALSADEVEDVPLPRWATARDQLAKDVPGETPATFPEGFYVMGDVAQFDAKVGASHRRVTLVREGSVWRAAESQPIDDPSGGTQIRFDMMVNEPSPPPAGIR